MEVPNPTGGVPSGRPEDVCQGAVDSASLASLSSMDIPVDDHQPPEDVSTEIKPSGSCVPFARQILLKKSSEHGFGFTLRHFIAYPPQHPSEIEFEEEKLLLGCHAPLETIFVKQVKPGSPAEHAGLITGDRILSVNEESVEYRSYQDIIALVQSSSLYLRLVVLSKEHDILQQVYGRAAYNPESNLNARFSSTPEPPWSSLSSSWSSRSSLSSLQPTYSPTYNGQQEFNSLPYDLTLYPSNTLTTPLSCYSQHSGNPNMSGLPRKGSTPVVKTPSTLPRSAQATSKLSSQSQTKRKPTAVKDTNKRKSPLVLDRKQAVYNIQNVLDSPKGTNSVESKDTPRKAATLERISCSKSSKVFSQDNSNSGVTNPISGQPSGASSKLEKEQKENVYEVVQTKLVDGNQIATSELPVDFDKRHSLPLMKSNKNILKLKGNSLPRTKKLQSSSSFDSHDNYSCDKSKTESFQLKSSNSSLDQHTQDVLDRIKRNVEQKEEFLRRPVEPIFKQESQIDQSKTPNKMWPPPLPCPPSPSSICKSLTFTKANKQEKTQNKSTKSDSDVKTNCASASDLMPERIEENPDLEAEMAMDESCYPTSRSVSLPSLSKPSVTSPSTSSITTNTTPSSKTPKTVSLHPSIDDNSSSNRYNRPFISKLARIHENIPTSNCDNSGNKTPNFNPFASLPTPYSTPLGSQTSLSSLPATPVTKTVPVVWVNDNERIRQLQIVSTRAKKFETYNAEREARKMAFYRFELSRLSQKANVFNVADRKKEFEKKSATTNKDHKGNFLEPGCFYGNRSKPPIPKLTSTKLVKSASDVGDFLATSKGYWSEPEVSSSTRSVGADLLKLRGGKNMTIPVGSSKIHCDPPDSLSLSDAKPDNEADTFERMRANSTCSHDSFWPYNEASSPQKKSTLVRQHSFHSTLQSHLALAELSESESERCLVSGGFIPPTDSYRDGGVIWAPSLGSSPPGRGRLERPTSLAIECHARTRGPGGSAPARPISHYGNCMSHFPFSTGAVSSLQQKLSTGIEGSFSAAVGVPAAGESIQLTSGPAGAVKRDKHLLVEDRDRVSRRFSYLKATSGERAPPADSDSDDERPHDLSFRRGGFNSGAFARRVTGAHERIQPEDLPSPASILSSVSYSGLLHLKLDKLNGKRAGDRSWKCLWVVMRGSALLFYKDKVQATQSPLSPEDQVTLRGAEAAVASDYTKKRHVFRVSTPAGSQFLFQAESEPTMTAWINSISAASADKSKDGFSASVSDSLSPWDQTNSGSLSTTPTSSACGIPIPSENTPSSEENVSPQLTSKSAKKAAANRNKSPAVSNTPQKSNKKAPGSSEVGSPPKPKTWKRRLGRHWWKMPGGSPSSQAATSLPEGASVGVCLEDCPPSPDNPFLPLLVSICVGVVESKGLGVQGVYRIPGNRAAVTYLTDCVNRGSNAIDLTDSRWSDVNVISSLLKQFFQKLPDPLIPSDLYDSFIEASKIDDSHQRLMELKHLVQELPDHHYETLRFLCCHLNNVTSNSAANKMDVRNLAIVFGPTLIRAADDNMAKMVTDTSHQCRIVELLISQVNWFFSEDELEEPPPAVSSVDVQSPLSPDLGVGLETTSQSLLLGNVQKLEATQKEQKKLLVSSIISAANRRVQKSRRKTDEDVLNNSFDCGHNLEPAACDPIHSMSVNRRRESSGPEMPSSNRDGRFFDESTNPLFHYGESPAAVSSYPADDFVIQPPVHSLPSLPSPNRTDSFKDDLPFRSYAGLNATTQERIRKFEQETKAMLQRETQRKRRELLDRQKLEEELQRAKKDLETEDIFDQLADNPSQVVHMMNSYCSSPNRETVGSVPYAHQHAFRSILPPGSTNASAKEDNINRHNSSAVNEPKINTEGSDLLSEINATFEKMKNTPGEPSNHGDASISRDDRRPSPILDSTGSLSDLGGKECSVRGSSKIIAGCKLYRDPSLHRRKALDSDDSGTGSLPSPAPHINGHEEDVHCLRNLDQASVETTEGAPKEKNEKRSRDPTRLESQECLKKPSKELKRSMDIQESALRLAAATLVLSSRREIQRDPEALLKSSELRGRRHNVKELKAKFENSSSYQPQSPTSAQAGEKLSRAAIKQARRARIKRRHTVGGMKDVARVAWIKVIEAANSAEHRCAPLDFSLSSNAADLPSWEKLQHFLETLAEERNLTIDPKSVNSWGLVKEQLGASTPDLDNILSFLLSPPQKEALKRRLSVREPLKPLHPVLESNV